MENFTVLQWRILAFGTVVMGGYFYLLITNKSKILKDNVKVSNPPFSLGRSQLAYWTAIILFCIFYVWFQKEELIMLTGDVLILLGISLGTTTTSRFIDNKDQSTYGSNTHQEVNKSENFFGNVMSDENGLSIHRVQNFVFSVAIGGYFLWEVWENHKVPDLDPKIMALMGASSLGYVAIKESENKSFKNEPVG